MDADAKKGGAKRGRAEGEGCLLDAPSLLGNTKAAQMKQKVDDKRQQQAIKGMPAPGTKTMSGRQVNSAKGNFAKTGAASPAAAAGGKKTGKSKKPINAQLKKMSKEEKQKLLAALQEQFEQASADERDSGSEDEGEYESEEENSE